MASLMVFATVSEHFCLDLGTVDERATLKERSFTAQSSAPMQCELFILPLLDAEGTKPTYPVTLLHMKHWAVTP